MSLVTVLGKRTYYGRAMTLGHPRCTGNSLKKKPWARKEAKEYRFAGGKKKKEEAIRAKWGGDPQ